MYDYGARMLMPDLGRWGAMDAMSEKYSAWSPYNYAVNNPVMVIDPDGNDVINTGAGMTATGADAQFAFKAYVATMSTSTESSGGNIFTGFGGTLGEDPKPGFWGRVSNWWDRLFGRNKGADILTLTRGAEVSRAVEVGEPIRIAEFFSAVEATSVAVGAATLGAVLTPVMMKDPEYNWTRDLPLTVPVTTTADEPDPGEMITLYRGVSSRIFHNDNSQYINAHFGIAIPKGYLQVNSLYGPHQDMQAHADSDNYSIWTSWTTSKETARDFATGIAFGPAVPGIIMSKSFKVGVANPNPYTLGENEWLVPGVVYGARVEYVLPRLGQ